MCVFMYVVHGHCGPSGPYPGPHTSWDPVLGSHIFAGPDGGLVGLVGLVGWVVGFGFGGLDSSFVGAVGLGFFLCARASSRYRSASSRVGKRRERDTLGRVVPPGYSTQTALYCRPWIPRTVPFSTLVG